MLIAVGVTCSDGCGCAQREYETQQLVRLRARPGTLYRAVAGQSWQPISKGPSVMGRCTVCSCMKHACCCRHVLLINGNAPNPNALRTAFVARLLLAAGARCPWRRDSGSG